MVSFIGGFFCGEDTADRVWEMAVPLIVINTLVIVYELVLG